MKRLFTSVIFSQFIILSGYAQSCQLWGLTSAGGDNGNGAIIKINEDGSGFASPYSFAATQYAGANSLSSMIQAADGNLYGMTSAGGANGGGVIFSYNPNTATYTNVYYFNDSSGNNPVGSLMKDSSGLLYGTTQGGGAYSYGVIFSYNPNTATYTDLFNFNGYSDAVGGLVQSGNGLLYGMTWLGVANDNGSIFSFNPATSVYTNLFDFNDTTGSGPLAGLMRARNGLLYGMTQFGGAYDGGIIFSYNPNLNTYTDLFDFNDTLGAEPYGVLVQDSNGILYGLTYHGGANGLGVIFSYNTGTAVYTRLYDFNFSDANNGGNIFGFGGLALASNGLLYGTIQISGTDSYGIIFSYNPNTGTYTTLFDFNAANGANPGSSLVQAGNGLLYGTTIHGGPGNDGVIFSYNPGASAYTKLINFNYVPDGDLPYGSLVKANNGLLYGAANAGGANGYGLIFSYNINNGTYTNIFDFNDTTGAYPYGSLVQPGNGLLYGTANNGGTYDDGVIFSYDIATATYTDLFDFNDTLGANPNADLAQDSSGVLYGMATNGGAHYNGVIFSYNPATAAYTKLFDFNNAPGGNPVGSLLEAGNGLLYGMTTSGGDKGDGVIFSYNPGSSAYTRLFDFNGTTGAAPYGGLLQASNGLLYGMATDGGNFGWGVIFSYNIDSAAYTDVYDFNDSAGTSPQGSLFQANNGLLYGMTAKGGAHNTGVIFSFDISTATYSKLEDLSAASGDYPNGSFIELGCSLGIKPISAAYDIKLYPNPTSDELFVQSDLFANNEIVFKLYDITGKLQSVNYVQQASQLEINTGNLAAGMYWLKININGEAVSRKFVKN